MKTVIAGSRSATFDQTIKALELCPWASEITEVVSGTARGADAHGEIWATLNRLPIRRFPADWGRYGKRAGPLRNEEMARYADALVVVWLNKSRGTAHMIEFARKQGLRVFVYEPPMPRCRCYGPDYSPMEGHEAWCVFGKRNK